MKKLNYIFLFLLLFSFCSNSSNGRKVDVDSIELITSTSTTLPSYYIHELNVPIIKDLSHINFQNCINFLGSNNDVECLEPYKEVETVEFGSTISNIELHDKFIYVVLKKGEIYQFDTLSNEKKLFYSNENVLDQQDAGLLSMAINDLENCFAISYVNKKGDLVVDKFIFEEDIFNYTLEGTIFKQEMIEPYTHVSGNLIWSNYLNTFLLSVGDNHDANALSRIDPNPVDTTSNLGKILSLNNINLDIPLYSSNRILNSQSSINENQEIKNVVVHGLRSPWQFFEFRNYLIVFDVGLSINEEMNIVNMENLPAFLGWPIFEAMSKSSEIDNIQNYEIDINYFDENKILNMNDTLKKLESETVMPSFFYNHYPTETDYRGAIIGGDIFSNSKSNYIFNIAFIEIVTKEIFLYDLTTGNVKLFPATEPIGGIVTSLRIYDSDSADIVLTTYDGELVFIKLNN